MNTFTDMQNCTLCPVECGANRITGVGACGIAGYHTAKIAKYYLHPYEEPCISFSKGSGTIFFCGCNLRCVFCQNYEVSRAKRGKEITPRQLTDVFKALEDSGADNISLVTPSHIVPFLEEAFSLYRPSIPVVYNSGGYEKVETLQRIDEYIDIYLPDIKFYSSALSKRYLGKEDYFEYAEKAIKFMAQKPLRLTDDGKMLSGCIVRHLVMPLCSADCKQLLKWFAVTLPESTYLSLMSQYTPVTGNAAYPELSRKITAREYRTAVDTAFSLGIKNIYLQRRNSAEQTYIPTWDY